MYCFNITINKKRLSPVRTCPHKFELCVKYFHDYTLATMNQATINHMRRKAKRVFLIKKFAETKVVAILITLIANITLCIQWNITILNSYTEYVSRSWSTWFGFHPSLPSAQSLNGSTRSAKKETACSKLYLISVFNFTRVRVERKKQFENGYVWTW